jgi:hypothetical protein
MIHIGRAGAKLGSFSEFEVRQGLASGRFLLTDLGWKEGMENWAALSEFPEFMAQTEAMPPLPDSDETPAEAGVSGVEGGGLPWDHGREIGFVQAFAQTAWMILLSPGEAFARMRTEGSLVNPVLYNMIGGWFGAVACGIYLVLTTRMQPPAPDPSNAHTLYALFNVPPAMAVRELKIFVVMGPILVTVSTLILSGIAHLFLMLAGGANKAYDVTLRVFCFSYGSAQLLQIIPFCGNLLAPVWLMVCCVVGLAIAHGTTTGRSLAAMALFLGACFLCCMGALFLAVGADYQSLRPLLNQ